MGPRITLHIQSNFLTVVMLCLTKGLVYLMECSFLLLT
ncbi:hypothetical protein LINPERPRIM_LOCUS33484 [Linum perenne]